MSLNLLHDCPKADYIQNLLNNRYKKQYPYYCKPGESNTSRNPCEIAATVPDTCEIECNYIKVNQNSVLKNDKQLIGSAVISLISFSIISVIISIKFWIWILEQILKLGQKAYATNNKIHKIILSIFIIVVIALFIATIILN